MMGHQHFNLIKGFGFTAKAMAIFDLYKKQQITTAEDQINFAKRVAVAMRQPPEQTDA